jgi:LuxR family transcriptional regulator, maltose regulon positive regulatory protein
LNTQPAIQNVPAATAVFLALAKIQYDRDELPAAQNTLNICIDLGRKAGWLHVLWQAYVLQAQVELALGNPLVSEDAVLLAERTARQYHIGFVQHQVAVQRARLALLRGDIETAAGLVEGLASQPDTQGADYLMQLVAARLYLASQEPRTALEILDAVEPAVELNGSGRLVIESLLLRSLALQAAGDEAAALEVLRKTLSRAAPENFLSIFLESGAEMLNLVSLVLQSRLERDAAFFSRRLVASFERHGLTQHRNISMPASPSSAMIEPLSERELEVLTLIAQGLSNPEIAARLFLSVNTLRSHATNIFQKLDVHSRTHAVARARELGVLKEK